MYKLLSTAFMVLALAILPLSVCSAAAKPIKPRANPNQPIEQIEFRDITVGDALRILSEQSNLNTIASKAAADIHVTMFLRRVTALEVIDAISKTYNLWYQHDENSNIIRLYTVKEYRLEEVEFKKEETEVFTLKNAKNALDLAETIQNLFSQRVQLSYGQNQQQLMFDLQQRFARFDMVDGRKKQQNSFSSGGGTQGGNTQGGNTQGGGTQGGNTQGGGNQGGYSQGGNTQGGYNNQGSGSQFGNQGFGQNNSNQQMDDRLKALDSVIGRLDAGGDTENRGNATSNLLVGDSQNSRDLIENSVRRQAPIYVGVIKHQNRVLVRTRDVDAMNEIRAMHKRLDMESSMLLMEVKVLSIDLSDGYDSLFDFKIKANDVNVSTGNATDTVRASEILDTGIRAAAAAIPNPALLATVISENFEARLQLLEKEGRVTQLATPMLLTSNQEVSSFLMGSTIPVLIDYTGGSTTTTGGGINSPAITQTLQASPIYEQRTIGNTLLLTPNINADNTVSVQIVVEEAALVKNGASILVPVGNDAPQSQLIDIVTEKTFSGSVIAKSGTAVAVGGIIQENAGGLENKVPVLGDIPGLGFFFREEHQSRSRSELVIIIKPHIINSPIEAEAVSKDMLANNSVHPSAQDGDSLGIYSNPDQKHNGYVLEQPYKEYELQDINDKHLGKGDSQQFPENQGAVTAQQVYMDLTRYAAETVRLPQNERTAHNRIQPQPLRQRTPISLLPDRRVKLLPVDAWRQGGIYVTAIEARNTSAQKLALDQRQLKGRWLAATLEGAMLFPRGDLGDSTYLYLISAEPFDDIIRQIPKEPGL